MRGFLFGYLDTLGLQYTLVRLKEFATVIYKCAIKYSSTVDFHIIVNSNKIIFSASLAPSDVLCYT